MTSSHFEKKSGRASGGFPAASRRGFTLLEILAVVGIIATLMGLVGSAAFSARQRAYVATATAETQQIAAALRAYFLAYHDWPNGINGETALDENNIGALLGDNSRKISFLQLPPDRIDESTRQFLDPWGHPYVADVSRVEEAEDSDCYETVISFPTLAGASWQTY